MGVRRAEPHMSALCDAVVHDESEEGDILFNIFDELYTLSRTCSDDAETWLAVAREMAFTRTSRFRAALYEESAEAPAGEEQGGKED